MYVNPSTLNIKLEKKQKAFIFWNILSHVIERSKNLVTEALKSHSEAFDKLDKVLQMLYML